jgi:hypothetical protein
MLLLDAIARAQVGLLFAFAAPATPNSEDPPVALMSTEEEPGERCSWQWEGLASGWECRENINYFSVKNDCGRRIKFGVMRWTADGAAAGWHISWYDFMPGQLGYLFDTKNRYIYIDAETNDAGAALQWPEEGCWAATNGTLCGFRIDMGAQWIDFTQQLTC